LIEDDGSPGAFASTIANAVTGEWHVLRVDHFPGQTQFRIDCFLLPTTNFSLTSGLQRAFIGRPFNNFSDLSFRGEVDQVQLRTGPWLVANNFCISENCTPPADDPEMFAYYDFNQGAAAGAGGGIGAVLDRSANGNDANLMNFDLATLNPFVESTAPLIGEGLAGLPFEIRDYPNRDGVLTGICSGDPAHFCLGPNGPPAHLMQQATVVWEFSDDNGATWTDLLAPPFTDYCFPILPDILTVDCTNNPDGFVDRQFRARMTVDDPAVGQSCTYFSATNTLRIRCPLTDVDVGLTPTDPVCAGDEIDFSVSLLTSHPWLTSGNSTSLIIWSLTGPGGPGAFTPANPLAFNYTFTAPALAQTSQFCFNASITDCSGASTFSACFSVDPEPDAGTIIGLPFTNPRNLRPIIGSPNPVYAICPGEDATLGEAIAAQNCRIQWQYTFNDPFTTPSPTWSDMGASNTVQNTNILPSHLWPNAATRIFYRYRCDPLSDPSGCEPDFSDTLEIRLVPEPQPVTLTGPANFCTGNFFELSFAGTEPGVTYQWFRNGVPFQTVFDTSYVEYRGGNYCVVADNGCVRVKGPVLTVEECTVTAAISCPLAPNECVNPGDDVTVEAVVSYTCDDQAQFTYEWSVNGVTAGNGPQLTYTANSSTSPLIPTVVKLVVRGPTSNCIKILERTITPCGSRY